MNIFKARINSDIFWVRFGKDLLIFTDDEMPEKIFGNLPRIYSFPKKVLQTEMYIVVQEERLFQRQNPEIPIIYDGGRYILVRLQPDLIEKIKKTSNHGKTFIPLMRATNCLEDHNLDNYRRRPNPVIQALVSQLDQTKVKEVLEFLAAFHTRFWTSSQYMAAAAEMKNRLSQMNYTTDFKNTNVIADKLGSGTGDRDLVLVTAHLDSIGTEDNDIVPAPGADDNASGCAGLIEIARIFQAFPNKHDLRFILFGGEEVGCIGSKDYIDIDLSPADRRRITAVINMDMIGFARNPSQKVLIEGADKSRPVITGLLGAAATYSNLTDIQTSLCSGESDHVSFIDECMPAVMTNEGIDPLSNDRIHGPDDTINTINYGLLLEILKMNVAYIAKEIG